MTALRDNSYAGTTTGAFTSGLGALAIGTGQKTRQITGVAAGNADTDAVNVAQLRSVSSRVKAYNETRQTVPVIIDWRIRPWSPNLRIRINLKYKH